MEPLPDTLRMRDKGKISLGIPKRLQTGETKSENAAKAPDWDKSSTATTRPKSDGKMSTAHFKPFFPPSVNEHHMFVFFAKA